MKSAILCFPKGGGAMTVIYLDILLTVNLLIDYMLLAAAARVLQIPTRRARLIFGAVLGAFSALIILLPPLSIGWSLGYKLLSAVCMVLVAFRVRTIRGFIKTTVVLFTISALFAGVCSGIWFWIAPHGLTVQNGVVYMDIEPLWLLLLTTVSYAVLCVYDRLTRHRLLKGGAYRIEIEHNDKVVYLRALYDSGHSLRDGFSGAPVIVASRQSLGYEVPLDVLPTLLANTAPFRYIPFSSIGGDGLLPAFRPARVILRGNQKEIDITGIWVALCENLGRGEYEALIGPSVAQRLADGRRESPTFADKET